MDFAAFGTVKNNAMHGQAYSQMEHAERWQWYSIGMGIVLGIGTC